MSYPEVLGYMFDALKTAFSGSDGNLSNTLELLEKTADFFSVVFTIIPPEVFLLYTALLFLLIIINAISPSTPKTNIGIALLLICSAWLYFNQLFHNELRLPVVVKYLLYVIAPVYGFAIIKFVFSFIRRRRLASSTNLRLHLRDIKKMTYQLDAGLDDSTLSATESQALIKELQKRLSLLNSAIDKID